MTRQLVSDVDLVEQAELDRLEGLPPCLPGHGLSYGTCDVSVDRKKEVFSLRWAPREIRHGTSTTTTTTTTLNINNNSHMRMCSCAGVVHRSQRGQRAFLIWRFSVAWFQRCAEPRSLFHGARSPCPRSPAHPSRQQMTAYAPRGKPLSKLSARPTSGASKRGSKRDDQAPSLVSTSAQASTSSTQPPTAQQCSPAGPPSSVTTPTSQTSPSPPPTLPSL
jgi:hypothetical protein